MVRSRYAHLWPLDPAVVFLNHGSFGACPSGVLEVQRALRDRMERQPVLFHWRELEGLLDESRAALARFIGADANDVAFVPNATAGVNAVLRSLDFRPGDELLTTNHDYGACRVALDYVAGRTGAHTLTAQVPFPLESEEQVVDAVLQRVSDRTRLVMVSHVTSPTGLIWPVERIVAHLHSLGIDTLVDGAHAPGMIDLQIDQLGAAYYTGNCHKWMCAPKGAGFLHVRRDRQHLIRPTIISHGGGSARANRSRFFMEFDWTGTADPTPYLCVPAAIRFIETIMPGGLPGLREHNRALAVEARRMLCQTLNISSPSPDAMIGSMAAVPLPNDPEDTELVRPTRPMLSPIPRWQDDLWHEHRIEVPVIPWPAAPKLLLRVSAQAYNALPEYEELCAALPPLLAAAGRGGA